MKKIIKILSIIIIYSLIILGLYFLLNKGFRNLLEEKLTEYYIKNMEYDVSISPMTKRIYTFAGGYATSSSSIRINYSKGKIFHIDGYYILPENGKDRHQMKIKEISKEDASKIKNIIENLESEDVDTKGTTQKKIDDYREDEIYYIIKEKDKEEIMIEDLPNELAELIKIK